MAPTTEPPPRRVFHILRKNRPPWAIEAETLCDVHDNGTHLRFKRAGKLVGEIEGDALAWWIEESGRRGKTYCMEVSADHHEMRVIADESAVRNRERAGLFVREFRYEGALVGVIYAPRYAAWRIE